MEQRRDLLCASLLVLLFASSGFCVTVTMQSFPARCGLDNGAAHAVSANGIPPYSYLWSTGATTQSVSGLPPGSYSVSVTDAIGGVANGSATVQALFELAVEGSFAQFQADCDFGCMGLVDVFETSLSGTGPYIYSEAPQSFPSHFGYQWVCSGIPNVITITDQNGCPGEVDLGSIVGNVDNSTVVVNSITGSCTGAANGTITVVLVGGDGQSYVHLYNFITQGEEYHYPPLNTPYVITGLAAGEYSISSWVNGWDGQAYCTNPYGQFTVPELPEPCGIVSGTVFNDADQDCFQDPDEPGLPYRILTVQPGPRYGMTDAQGGYFIGMPFGSYTLVQPLVDEAQLCPVAVPVPFTVDGGTPSLTIDVADSSLVPHDLELLLYSTAFRPGFPFNVWGSVRNNTAYASGVVSVTLNYPTLLDPVTASNGGTITTGSVEWSFPVLPAYGFQGFGFSGTVPPDVNLLGQELVMTASATNTIGEASLANNTFVLSRTITGSYDPNDKRGVANSSGSDAQFFLAADEWIDYTVRFQNTGTDTAYTVVIRDQIELDLDIQSLEILGASHDFNPSFGEGRELILTFPNIQLPDSTTNLLASQGFAAFRMKPRSGLLPGDLIENIANIYFDFNPAVITEPSVLVAEFSTDLGTTNDAPSEFMLLPNPANDRVEVRSRKIIGSLRLLTADGRLMRQSRVGSSTALMDLNGLANGMYVVELMMTDGSVVHEHLIKN